MLSIFLMGYFTGFFKENKLIDNKILLCVHTFLYKKKYCSTQARHSKAVSKNQAIALKLDLQRQTSQLDRIL